MANDMGAAAAHGQPKVEIDRTTAANYVAELSAELATLARHHGLDTLAYLLDMARLEAETVKQAVNGRR